MSAALSMFRKTAGHGDVKKSAQKVADSKKDSLTRLKHLRAVLDNYDIQEAKKFFLDHYSHIYYIFYDNFGLVENDLKQRANKAHREELEGILHIFEKILFLLPEIIHKRWMFHSIGRILKKLLHPGNSLLLRRQGLRLFLVWYQILQDNASEECHSIFQQLIPGLGSNDLNDLFNLRASSSYDAVSGMIAAGEITPILPSSSEKVPDNTTKYFLDHLLNYMVSEVIKIEWMNKEMREISFNFLFNKFKSTYLTWLLPEFCPCDIYEPTLEMPRQRSEEEMQSKDEPVNVAECRDSFIIWLANFTMTSRRPDPDITKGLSCSALTEGTAVGEERKDDLKGDGQELPAVNRTIMPGDSSGTTDLDSLHSSQGGDEHSVTEYVIVRTVLYSTRENVNILHECFRQALLFSFKHTSAIRKVIAVYKEWFQNALSCSGQQADQQPVFMMEPNEDLASLDCRDMPDFLHSSLSDIMEEEGPSSDDSPNTNGQSLQQLGLIIDDHQRYKRNRSYLGAVAELAGAESEQNQDVRAGVQKILQVFITNAANIFLLNTADSFGLVDQQAVLLLLLLMCKRW